MLTSVPTTLARVVLALASTITALLVGEGIARLGVHYPLTFPWTDQINGVIAPRLGVRGRHFVPGTFDTTFSFSAQRFRGQQVYQPAPAPGAIRIAALGASFTFGSGANDNETYPSQLQSVLQERSKQNHSNFAFEVINAGIAGSVTGEQALWYENWVRQFHPHVVILGVGCTVDHEDPREVQSKVGCGRAAGFGRVRGWGPGPGPGQLPGLVRDPASGSGSVQDAPRGAAPNPGAVPASGCEPALGPARRSDLARDLPKPASSPSAFLARWAPGGRPPARRRFWPAPSSSYPGPNSWPRSPSSAGGRACDPGELI